MLQYDEKLVGEEITLSWDATALLPDGVTLSTVSVAVTVYEYSDKTDANPSAIKSGSAQVNASAVTLDDGVVVAIGKAGLQKFTAGLAGVEYQITWNGVRSDGLKESEQGILPVVDRFS